MGLASARFSPFTLAAQVQSVDPAVRVEGIDAAPATIGVFARGVWLAHRAPPGRFDRLGGAFVCPGQPAHGAKLPGVTRCTARLTLTLPDDEYPTVQQWCERPAGHAGQHGAVGGYQWLTTQSDRTAIADPPHADVPPTAR